MKSVYIPQTTETVVKVIPSEVILSLSLEEAMYLCKLCDSIGGSPTGPRGNFDRIREKLVEILPNETYSSFCMNYKDYIPGHRNIYFD